MQEKKIKYLTIGVLTLVFINIVLIALLLLPPQFKTRKIRMERDKVENRGAQFLMNRLNLTVEQRASFKPVFEKHKIRRDSLEQAIHQKKRKLAQDMLQNDYDTAAVNEILNDLDILNRKAEMEMLNHFRELKEICTPEQQLQLRKTISKINDRK